MTVCSPESWVLSITQRYGYTVARKAVQGMRSSRARWPYTAVCAIARSL